MDLDRQFIFTADSQFSIATPEGKAPVLSGYALVWNVPSTDRGGYKVRLMPGSAEFMQPTLGLYNHDSSDVLGNTENGTLRLMPDAFGVKFEMDLPDTQASRDVQELVGKKYVRGMSFRMAQKPQGEPVKENGETIFNARKFRVSEITVTGNPAFVTTNVQLQPGFSAQIETQSVQLQRFRLNMFRLPGAVIPRAAV
jgi:HK97 family phage prohead protease